jgi:hypothetical protein
METGYNIISYIYDVPVNLILMKPHYPSFELGPKKLNREENLVWKQDTI